MLMSRKKKFQFNLFDIFAVVFCCATGLICFYPMWYVFLGSIDPSDFVASKGIIQIIPSDVPSFRYYTAILSGSAFLRAISVSFYKTFITSILSLIITSMMAYGISKKYIKGMDFFNLLIIFTMFFGGGLIPTFLLIRALKLYDTFWAMVIPQIFSVGNFIIMRNYFSYSVPKELEDASVIDGANEFVMFFRIIIPISMPMFAAIFLFEAVRNWNDWYSYLIFVNKQELRPIIEVLRKILIDPTVYMGTRSTNIMGGNISFMPPAALKMTTIMIATMPILLLYPFLQKYFAKGILIGAVKG